jgi:hypothetical protein
LGALSPVVHPKKQLLYLGQPALSGVIFPS